MVRVNLISVKLLTDEHLIAENVELIMLLTFISKHPTGNIPDKYTLGKGHMSFFRDKALYIVKRLTNIHKEMLIRGFKVNSPSYNFEQIYLNMPQQNKGDYNPSLEDIILVTRRIIDRIDNPLKKRTTYHYYKIPIDKNYKHALIITMESVI
jgi:deoxyribonuclease (pyrimidine dimer)